MLVIPDVVRVARRRQIESIAPSPPEPVLVAASFDVDTEALTMTFDRAVAIDAYDPSTARVNVPAMGALYAPDSRVTLGPGGRSVTAEGEIVGPSAGVVAWLTVPAGNGIVDASTGVAWPGVERVPLPFG